MSNVTISDIAKKAQVSLGTVSNVLNNRGNVKVETIKKVEAAAKELHYVRNVNALAIRTKQSTKIALIMPKLNDSTSDLHTNLYHELKKSNLTLELFETKYDLVTERDCYRQIQQDNYLGILVINNLLAENKIKQLLGNPKNLIFISNRRLLNNRQILIDLSTMKKVIDSKNSFIIRDDLGFGFYKEFSEKSWLDNSMTLIYQKMQQYPQAQFVTFNSKLSSRIKNIADTLKLTNIKIILLTPKNIVSFQDSTRTTNFHYSANKLALEIMSMLQSNNQSAKIEIYNTNYQIFKSQKFDSTLKILLLETHFSKILQQLIPDLTAKYGIKVDLVTKNFEEMQNILADDNLDQYDLVRLDISDFNWFGKYIFQPLSNLPQLSSELDSLKNWQQYIYLDKIPYGLPLDPSVQMMLYQKDIFNNSIMQKQYFDKFGKSLLPPETYQELIDFSEFIHSSEMKNYYPVSLINDNSVLIASEFLPYYYSLGGKISFEKILKFDSELFIKAFEMYRQLRSVSKIETGSWWNSEITSFKDKKTGLLIGFSNHLNNIDPNEYAVAPIPGNTPALGGGLIGITKGTDQLDESVIFLKWLYQYQIQHEIALMGGDVPANNLFFEREIYEQFPFLSKSIDLYHTGIRKTIASKNINLHTLLFEKIIGKELSRGIKEKLDSTTVLLNINTALINYNQELTSQN